MPGAPALRIAAGMVAALPVAAAERGPCGDVVVAAPAPGPALALLRSCGLAQRARLAIEVVPRIEVAGTTDCLGSYDCRDRLIRLVEVGRLDAVVSAANPFSALAPEADYASIVMHEMAHAVFDQPAPGARPAAHEYVAAAMQHEYVAAAMQFAALAAPDRVLEGFGGIGEVRLRELTGTLAAMAPLRFAAKAWMHFAAPGNDCAFVRDLATGRVSLARP